ncbi:MAG: hypothetical protein K2O42_05385 [Oscillospiraceae bacterium]|nr:hypothetical protein [Oscillospiraceae bacterium]
MSRSYKKFPVVKDRFRNRCSRTTKDRWKPKTFANRAVRRSKGIPGGKGGYRKIYCSWNICDYWIYEYSSKKSFKRAWDNGDEFLHRYFKNYEEALWDWKKCYIRK